MRILILTVAVLSPLLIAVAADQGAEVPDLSNDPDPVGGVYAVRGENYSGVAVIHRVGESYVAQFSTFQRTEKEFGTLESKAVGQRTGDTLSLSWGDEKVRGNTLYQIQGKTLRGTWVQTGSGKRQTETLTYIAPLPKALNGGDDA